MNSYKRQKIIKIVQEIEYTGSNKIQINGTGLEKAIFFVKKERELFKLVASGDYSIIYEGSNIFLFINELKLQNAKAVQIAYELNTISSEYDTNSEPDINILKDKYNMLVQDFKQLWDYIQKQTLVSDTLSMELILPKLENGETWVYKDGEMKAIILYDAVEELKKSVEQTRQEVLQELQTKINEFNLRINTLISDFRIEIQNVINTGKTDINNIINKFESDWAILVTNAKKEITDLTTSQKTSITELTNTSKTEITTHVTNQKNTITTLVNNSKTELNSLIQNEKTNLTNLSNTEQTGITNLAEEKKDEIRELAEQTLGFEPDNYLLKGGTQYNSAEQMENDIKELQEREGGDIVRVKFSIGTYYLSQSVDPERYLKISDLNNVEITNFDKTKKYIGEINITDNSGIGGGNVVLYDGSQTYQVHRTAKYKGNFTQNTIDYTDFPQYSIQELYWTEYMDTVSGTGSWAFKNSNLPFNNYAPGLFNSAAYGDLKQLKTNVNMNMGAYTDEQIIDNLNTVYMEGRDAAITMFMYGSGLSPTLSCDTTGNMFFDSHNTTMRLLYIPKTTDGYVVTSAECRVPMILDSTANKHIMDNTFVLRNIGNWKFYGNKQKLYEGSISKTLNSTTMSQTFLSTDFNINFPVWSFKRLIVYGNIQTSRMTSNAVFPFKAYIETNSYNRPIPVATYITKNGSWEQINVVGNIEGTTVNSQLSMTFSIANRNGSFDVGDCTAQILRIDTEFF